MKTLLEKAKDVQIRKTIRKAFSEEEMTVCLAFIKGEITARQAYTVLYPDELESLSSGKFYSRLVPVVRNAYSIGRIKVV